MNTTRSDEKADDGMPPPRQTQSYLRRLFDRRGIAPRHRMGQNFLVDLNIHDLIVEEAAVAPGDLILEVGPGAGALTSLMARRGASVVAVEFDPGMAKLTGEVVAGLQGTRVIEADALANKNTLNPLVIDSLHAGLCAAPGRPFKLVANLPYSVATPVISNLLVHPDLHPELMVVTIQRELADRMIAAPSTPDYGSLSVLMQALTKVSIVRVLAPSVFWPRPKVESAVVRIEPIPGKREAMGDVAWFQSIVRRIFLHRRKNLRHVLSGMWSDRWTKPEVDTFLAGIGLDGQLRAEALEVAAFVTLAIALKNRFGKVENDRTEIPDHS